MSFRCLALAGLLLAIGVAAADTRYISDNLTVDLLAALPQSSVVARAPNTSSCEVSMRDSP